MSALNIQQVELLNKKAQQLNSQRQQMIGAKESARNTFDKSTFAYQQKYGVTLDDTNLQQEYNTVSTQMQTEFDALNALVYSIESGEYKKVAEPALDTTPQPVQAPVQQTIQQPVQAPVQQFSQPVQPVQQPVQQNYATPVINSDVLAHINSQQAPPPVFGQPVMPQPAETLTATPVQPTQDVSEQSFQPAGWGTPNKDLDQNFTNIMGSGTQFGKQ